MATPAAATPATSAFLTMSPALLHAAANLPELSPAPLPIFLVALSASCELRLTCSLLDSISFAPLLYLAVLIVASSVRVPSAIT